jgi:hypothetical protein
VNDWRVVYLRALGAKPTPAAMEFLAKWQPFEGGHTNNDAKWNFLNTTQRMPGSHSINSVGVQSYGSLAQGAQAFARTLRGDERYAGLVSFLRSGQGDPTPGLQTWVSGSPTGNPGYAAKVTGAHVASSPSPSPSSSSVAVPTSDFTPLTEPGVDQEAKRQYAVSGLGDIAHGKRASEVFADTSKFMSGSMRSLVDAIPKVDIPTVDQGGSDLDTQATSLVQKYLGVKYTWGGTTVAGGFDCSGLVQTVWKQLGVQVPRTSQEQWRAGQAVSGDPRPGDAVFFGSADAPHHEGLYVGNGKFIEAPHTGAVVRLSDLAGRSDYVGARRFA